MDSPYGRRSLQRSLLHFGAGKLLGLVVGLGWMLLLVRTLPALDYGLYVAFTGIGELSMLGFGLGLTQIAERYVPELKLAGRYAELRALAMRGFVLRIALLLAGSLLVVAAAPLLLGDAGREAARRALPFFMVSVLGEAAGRWTETVFDSLLLQSHSQVSILVRYGSRLAMLAWYAHEGRPVTLQLWVMTEAACYLASALFSAWLMHRVTASDAGSADAAGAPKLELRRYLRFAWPSYMAELVSLLSSLDMTKLLIARLFGAPAAALAGFCLSLCWMLQRYLPSFLLIGMLRPLFVSALQAADPPARLTQLFNLLIKLNVFIMVPAIALGAMHGDALIDALSGGRFHDGGLVLSLLLVLILSQAVRQTLNLLASVFEDGHGRLISTVAGNVIFGAGVLVSTRYGLASLLCGLVAADIAACACLLWRIRGHGLRLRPPLRAVCTTAVAAAAVSWLMQPLIAALGGPGAWSLLASTAAAGLGYLILTAALKPFDAAERNVVNSMIPRKLFIW